MDPLTSFVTIVSLLAAFESSSQGRNDIKEFKDWLNENNYAYMTAIIDNNESLHQDLSLFMNQNHDQVMSQLATLNDLMVSIASHMQGLGNIASSFAPNSGLSEQAVDVLRQFVESGSKNMRHMKNNGLEGNDFYILEGAPDIKYDEPRFIKDDLDSLVKTGLITSSLSPKNKVVYRITRQAVRFIDAIDNE